MTAVIEEQAMVRPGVRAVVTMDLHHSDSPWDIAYAGEWLAAAGVRVTAFIPTAMLEEPRYRPPIRALATLGHEVASHTHHHDWAEMEALRSGRGRALAFLSESRERHGEFFGHRPTAFRSPAWCRIGRGALDELARLDYQVDASATPQRLPGLNAEPFQVGWLTSPRAPYFVSAGLLEIPTSTLLFPLGASTILTFRAGVKLMLAVLALEARLSADRVLVIQTHAEDWNPDAARAVPHGRLTWRDFLPKARGGLGFRRFLHARDSRAMASLHRDLLAGLARFGLGTLADVRADWSAREALPD